jgi:NADH:ubiquinone oxidoreductase subunit 2 (subunit N)
VAIVGVVISLYYYLGVVRAIYWSKGTAASSRIEVSLPMRACLYACIAAIFYLGLFPDRLVNVALEAVKVLKL